MLSPETTFTEKNLMRVSICLNVFRKLSFLPLLSGSIITEFHIALVSTFTHVCEWFPYR